MAKVRLITDNHLQHLFTLVVFVWLSQNLPVWWLWFYYICPVAWTLRGVITSQLGDVETRIVGPGFDGTVKQYLEESLGYGPGMLSVTAVVLIAFSLVFFTAYATSIKVLNYQRRWPCMLTNLPPLTCKWFLSHSPILM